MPEPANQNQRRFKRGYGVAWRSVVAACFAILIGLALHGLTQ